MIKNTNPGKFIVFEGFDGAGKATQAAAAVELLRIAKKNVLLTCEPTGSPIGDLIRECLVGNWQSSPECLQLLFAADRAAHLHKEIIPALSADTCVICDRYAFSSFAYGAIECSLDWLFNINKKFILPDLTVFLNVSPSACVDRLAAERKPDDIFEKLDILEKVILNYKKAFRMFEPKGAKISIIDGGQSVETVSSQINAAIKNFL